ncbi:MAG: hypothetical protein ACRC2H_05635 [Silanimonas sp.]
MQNAGISNVRIEGDQERGRLFVRDAERTLLALQEMLRAGGITTGGLGRQLAPDVQCYVRVADGINVIQIIADERDDRPPSLIELASEFPDFYSGWGYGGFIEERRRPDGETYRTMVNFRPSADTIRKFELADGRQESARLAVNLWPGLDGAFGPASKIKQDSQYTRVKATAFSGTMVKLVQFVLGYGRIPEESWYDTRRRAFPEGKVPPQELPPPQTAYDRDISRNGVRMRYDFRFFRTHGLTRAADGKWWLVEISSKGILAKPLPLFQKTTTEEFRRVLMSSNDEQGLEVLDLFGGFPTGEAFPTNESELDAMIRAGVIVRERPEALSEFLRMLMYSSMMGFAFNESGSRADNTAYYYGEDDRAVAVHYSCSMKIEASEEFSPSSSARTLKIKMLGQSDRSDFKDKIGAILVKIDRLSNDEVGDFLSMEAAAAFSELDSLVLDPIAAFEFDCRKVVEQRVHGRLGPMKFWEPLLGGLVSVDWRPIRGATGSQAERWDVPVHVFYVGDTLNWVKAFRVPSDPETKSDAEVKQCSLPGNSFVDLEGDTTITEVSEGGNYAGPLYTNDFDDRELVYTSTKVSKWKSRRTGEHRYRLGDDLSFPPRGFLSRDWVFRVEESVDYTSGRTKQTAVSVPAMMREAYYYAVLDARGGGFTSTQTFHVFVQDPYSYETWRNFPGWTGFLPMGCAGSPRFPSCWTLQEHPEGCGKVRARTVREEFYNPNDCSSLVDNGPWSQVCQNADSAFGERPPPNATNIDPVAVQKQRESRLVVKFIYGGDYSSRVTYVRTVTGEGSEFNGFRWFDFSPTDTGFYDWIYAKTNRLGTSDTLIYSPTINTGFEEKDGFTWHVGQPFFNDMGDVTSFIGVINE